MISSKYINRSLAFIIGLLLLGCEDPIEVPSQFEESQLVIDAWLTNTDTTQVIRLSQTTPYFQGGVPPQVDGATVTVCRERDRTCFEFEGQGAGEYRWEPNGTTFGQVGDTFTLEFQLDGTTYSSSTSIRRTAEIDSISVFFEEETLFTDEGLYAELFARDQPGRGDTYWIRATKNDTLLNRPTEIAVVFDATFDAGADLDGIYFLPPLRAAITPLDDDGLPIPFEPGDRITAEVHSINETAFRFLTIAAEQITNEGIFAVPVANAPGNVVREDTGEPILGIFNIAEVVRAETVVE